MVLNVTLFTRLIDRFQEVTVSALFHFALNAPRFRSSPFHFWQQDINYTIGLVSVPD